MARIPEVKAFTGTSVEVLNAIRNSASTYYRDFVPFAQPDSASVKKIGAVIMQYPALQNEFLNALINRIGLVIVTNKLYSNPWRMFKKGILDMGESVEEIFVNIAKVSQFDPAVAEETVMRREIPDVRATFHIMNYQKFYKDTISDDQLRQAFLSWDGVTDLIARIVNSMYTAAEYDEFLVMRYMLARMILDGNVASVSVPQAAGQTDAEYNRAISTRIKAVSNNMTFLSSDYNLNGVMTHTEKSEQYLITTVDFDANLDVESLAFAFNMDKIQFAGNRVLVPSFGFSTGDRARLGKIFEYDSTYEAISDTDNTALNDITCALVSGNFFRVYDNLIKFTEIYNSEGLYWNYSLHTWKTFSASPFENAVVFTKGAGSGAFAQFIANTFNEDGEATGTAHPVTIRDFNVAKFNVNDGIAFRLGTRTQTPDETLWYVSMGITPRAGVTINTEDALYNAVYTGLKTRVLYINPNTGANEVLEAISETIGDAEYQMPSMPYTSTGEPIMWTGSYMPQESLDGIDLTGATMSISVQGLGTLVYHLDTGTTEYV